MENYKLTIMKETFNNTETGQEVDGLTLMIEGRIKEVFDTIINSSEQYTDYSEVLKDTLFMGLSHIIYKTHSEKKQS